MEQHTQNRIDCRLRNDKKYTIWYFFFFQILFVRFEVAAARTDFTGVCSLLNCLHSVPGIHVAMPIAVASHATP